MGAIGDDENLDILKKTAGCPEAVSLIALDLVEGFPNGDTSAFKLNMNQWHAIRKDGYIITSVVSTCGFLILVDDLQLVVVNILFIYYAMFLVKPLSSLKLCRSSTWIFRVLLTIPSFLFVRYSLQKRSHSLS